MRYVQGFLRQMLAGFTVLLAFTVILGIGYPAVVWAVSRLDTHSAEGSPLEDQDGCTDGSSLIGVDPQVPAGEVDPYFHTRTTGSVASEDPFAPGDPAAGLPTNLGPNSELLASFAAQRRAHIADREGVDPAAVPVDAVTGSGSGLDPHISPAYAAIQVARVAQSNGRSIADVEALVSEYTDGPQYGVLGETVVNVPQLNSALGLNGALGLDDAPCD